MIIGITGGPKTGKTTAAMQIRSKTFCGVFHTDDVADWPWPDQPAEIIERVSKMVTPLVVVEGVQVPRAIRRGLQCEWLVILDTPVAPQTPKQIEMTKGINTVIRSLNRDRLSLIHMASVEEAVSFVSGFK